MKLPADTIKTQEVTQWQGLHLLHYHMSSCSQKVRILMGELGINYQSHHVDLRADEQKTDWYLGINPNGVVPVLVHNGEVHIESNDIIAYLDAEFATPETTLLPEDTKRNPRMQTLLDLEDRMHKDLRTVTFTYLAPNIHGDDHNHQDQGYIARFHGAFSELEKALAQHPYLLGERITLPDIAWFITLHRLHLARYPLHEHPKLNAYYQRLASRPAFKQQVTAGPAALRAAGAAYRTLNRVFKRSLAKDYQHWRLANPA